jgi:hypothetical protein
MKTSLPLIGLAFLCIFGNLGHAEDKKPHVALVVDTLDYSPELSMPLFVEEIEWADKKQKR